MCQIYNANSIKGRRWLQQLFKYQIVYKTIYDANEFKTKNEEDLN